MRWGCAYLLHLAPSLLHAAFLPRLPGPGPPRYAHAVRLCAAGRARAHVVATDCRPDPAAGPAPAYVLLAAADLPLACRRPPPAGAPPVCGGTEPGAWVWAGRAGGAVEWPAPAGGADQPGGGDGLPVVAVRRWDGDDSDGMGAETIIQVGVGS